MAATHQATTAAKASGNVTSLTFSATVASGTGVLGLVVMVACSTTGTVEAYYGGVPLTYVGGVGVGSWAFEMFDPPVGTANVEIRSHGGSQSITAAAHVIEQYGGIRTVTSTAGGSTTPSINVTTVAGDLVLDLVSSALNGQLFAVGAGQTSLHEQDSEANNDTKSASSYEVAAGASTTMSWTITNAAWRTIAVAIADDGDANDLRVGGHRLEVMEGDDSAVALRVGGHRLEILDEAAPPELRVGGHRLEILEDSNIPVPPTPPGPLAPSVYSTTQRALCGLGGSQRKLMRSLPSVTRIYTLGDIGTLVAFEDVADASGTYNHTPHKALGILPEWGPSSRFDGVDDHVAITTGLTSGAFSVSAMIRPHASGTGLSQVMRTGPASNGALLGITSAGHARFGADAALISGGPRISGGGAYEYNLVGVYDGSNASLWVNGTRVAGPTAISITGHGAGRIGAGFSQEFRGDIQNVAMFAAALSDDEVGDIWETAEWSDITPDMRDTVPLVIDRGIHSDRPEDRIARTGTCSFGLDNSAHNSAGLLGYYSPGHVNARPGFDRGSFVRLGLSVSGITYPQFTGKIKSIKPEPGVYDDRITHVFCTDWMDEAAQVRLKGLGIATTANIGFQDALEDLINAMRNKPHGLDIRTGSETWPLAFDYSGDGKATVAGELKRIVDSEAGLIYISGTGTLVCENRASRAGDADPAHSIVNNMTDAVPERNTDQVINNVEVTVYPRRVDAAATTVLYENDGPITIVNGTTMELSLDYRDPDNESQSVAGLDVIEPQPTTDYLINMAEDGSAADVTASVDVIKVWIIESNSVRLRITNNFGAPLYFTFLRVRGRGVYNYAPLTFMAKNLASIEEDGSRDSTFQMPYQGSGPVGESIAALFLNGYALMPTRIRTVTFKLEYNYALRLAGLTGDISTRVLLTETVSGVSGEFYINAVKIDWKEAQNIDVTWHLSPADTQTYWIFDTSTFDETTRFSA